MFVSGGFIMSSIVKENKRLGSEELLGIKFSDNLELADRIEEGFSFGVLQRLSDRTGLPLDSVRAAVRISPRTFTRRRKENRLSPEESDRLVSVSRIVSLAFALFEGEIDAGLEWLLSPNRALGGRSPMEMAATETGAREVESLIGRLEHGVFT